MTRELLGRVSKASQELFGQNAGLRALRVFETKTEELLRPESSWDERNPCLGAVSGMYIYLILGGGSDPAGLVTCMSFYSLTTSYCI